MSYFVKADCFLLEDGEKRGSYLQITDGHFGGFFDEVPANAKIVDWTGYTIAPGLFDTHIHGVQGHDIMDGTIEAVQQISASLLLIGVTRFLPTTLTSSPEDLNRAISAIRSAVANGLNGAQSEGIFLEGPYFTEKHKGAQNPGYFRDPSLEEFQAWQQLADGSIVKIALAPEREGAFDFIREVSERGVLASIAHTDADHACCRGAVDAGARVFVHLFNGMKGIHHREPGVAGAALSDERAYAELICDGHHVHPTMAKFAYQVKGDKLVMITDCMRAGLMPDGNYHLGEFPVTVDGGIALTETGSLAGSTLRLIDGVRNLQQWSDAPLYHIWHRASLSPAASLGKDNELGSIASGKIADFVVLDQGLNVQAVVVGGVEKYRK